MKGKILGAVLAAMALAGLNVAPAQAYRESFDTSCRVDDGGVFYPSHEVCITATYRTSDNVGITLVSLVLSCRGRFENDPAVDGHLAKVINEDGDTKWYRGESTNIPGVSCAKKYTNIMVKMPRTRTAIIYYTFSAKYNNQPDPERRTVALNMCRFCAD
jgi:hypothetical protein